MMKESSVITPNQRENKMSCITHGPLSNTPAGLVAHYPYNTNLQLGACLFDIAKQTIDYVVSSPMIPADHHPQPGSMIVATFESVKTPDAEGCIMTMKYYKRGKPAKKAYKKVLKKARKKGLNAVGVFDLADLLNPENSHMTYEVDGLADQASVEDYITTIT
jgi:hypothetical protein